MTERTITKCLAIMVSACRGHRLIVVINELNMFCQRDALYVVLNFTTSLRAILKEKRLIFHKTVHATCISRWALCRIISPDKTETTLRGQVQLLLKIHLINLIDWLWVTLFVDCIDVINKHTCSQLCNIAMKTERTSLC